MEGHEVGFGKSQLSLRSLIQILGNGLENPFSATPGQLIVVALRNNLKT